MNKPNNNDASANDAVEPTGPDDRSAHPAAADGENQRRLNEVPNQLSYKQKKSITIRLAIATLVLGFCGFLLTLADKLGFFEQFRDPGVAIKEYVKQAERHAEKAKHLVEKTRSHLDEAEKMVKAIRKMTAEMSDVDPAKAKQVAGEIGNKLEASQLEKAIARALSLQLENKTDLAIEEWENIVKRVEGIDNEQAATAWLVVGYLRQEEDPVAGISAYDKAINLNPDDALAYNTRGIAKKALGRYDDAIADYNEAIRLEPGDADAYNNRGIAKKALGHLDDALADYDAAIRLEPDYAGAYYNRGIAKKALGRLDDALADYDAAIRLEPDYAGAYNNRGVAKEALGRLDDALADYDAAIRLEPDYAGAYNNRGIAKKALGHLDDALADYDAAIRLEPDYAGAYNNRGVAKEALGRLDDALADYDAAIRLEPDYAGAYNNRGIAKAALNRKAEARQDFETALELAQNANNTEEEALIEQALRLFDSPEGS